MRKTIQSGRDVIEFLKSQHVEVRVSLRRVQTTHGSERADAFLALCRLLAIHEATEEEIVHPVARNVLVNGHDVVDARLLEEDEAKMALSELERLDVDSVEFESRFGALTKDIVAHAEAEEHDEFEELIENWDIRHVEHMQKAARIAETISAARPHPGAAPKRGAVTGAFATMLTRTREALWTEGTHREE